MSRYKTAIALASLLAALPAACGGGGQSSTGGLDDQFGCQVDENGRETCICYDAAHLSLDTFLIKWPSGDIPTGHPNHVQHVKAGACEAYLFWWIDEQAMFSWFDLVTNCAEPSLGGMTSNGALPAGCMREAISGGGQDSGLISYQMGCVCCIDEVCGRSCHDIPHLTCASYDYDFPVPTPDDDPRNHPDVCDCSNTP